MKEEIRKTYYENGNIETERTFVDDERFHMQIKTKDFEIIVSKGTSSYQMNINNLKI